MTDQQSPGPSGEPRKQHEHPATWHLPPRPDPQTGEPFPPPGLSYLGRDDKAEDDPGRELRLSRRPEPPPGMGPVLAWHRENARGKISLAAWSLTLFAVSFGAISLMKGDGLDMLSSWLIWVFILGGTLLISSPLTFMVHSAGSDWLQITRIRWGVTKSNNVKLYELQKVDAFFGGTNLFLYLWDGERAIERSFEELQTDRRIWDLIYNGILHSVANGAEVTKQAVGILELNHVPGLKYKSSYGGGSK
ncbi:MAG: hypothetical protein ACRDQ7_03585 [Haloechinothrix sp.]